MVGVSLPTLKTFVAYVIVDQEGILFSGKSEGEAS